MPTSVVMTSIGSTYSDAAARGLRMATRRGSDTIGNMSAMPSDTSTGDLNRSTAAAPPALRTLIGRFDPEVIDVPSGRARIRLAVRGLGAWDARIESGRIELRPADEAEPDAVLSADAQTWEWIAEDIRGGMDAFRKGRLSVRQNLHLGIGLLAATSGIREEGRLRFDSVRTGAGRISTVAAGEGPPVLCLHGLGGTKASFLPTIAALADSYRVVAMDLPGFGESDKPLTGAYDAPFFAKAAAALLDELAIDRAHLIGNSMGGRVAIEFGLLHSDRTEKLALLSPALAWLRDRRWRWLLSAPLPKLGLIQPAPRVITEPIVRSLVPGGRDGWSAAGVDEFLRSFLTPRGRVAFYEAARNVYLDEPHGEQGLWTRLETLAPDALFIWGRHDQLVPIAFMKHVERALPQARHVELDCGHVPQLEAPGPTHRAILQFFAAGATR
jgi:pimeloyl-ACP methyl ester carboxylesterase